MFPLKTIDVLCLHQRAICDVIEEFGEIAPSDLYQEYRNRVEKPKPDRTVRNHLKKMIRNNHVTAAGQHKTRSIDVRSPLEEHSDRLASHDQGAH